MPSPEPRFLAPRSLEEALEANAEEGALALAGGTSLTALIHGGLVQPASLVYLGRLLDLQGIERTGSAGGERLRVGAGVTWRQLARDNQVREMAPLLAQVAGSIANPRVRSVATLGGALAHADPRQDLPPILLVLDGYVRLASPTGTREVPLAAFYRGVLDTVVADDELVVEVTLPWPAKTRPALAYERFTPASDDDFPTVAVAVALVRDEAGQVEQARLALAGVGPTALLVPEAARLVGHLDPETSELEALAEAAARAARPSADRHGSISYKQEMVRVHVLRALRSALGSPTSSR